MVPLSFAVYLGNETMFQLLIDNGANPSLVTSESMNTIAQKYSSVTKGDESVVIKLVSHAVSCYIRILILLYV